MVGAACDRVGLNGGNGSIYNVDAVALAGTDLIAGDGCGGIVYVDSVFAAFADRIFTE